jgi:DNA polymerase V
MNERSPESYFLHADGDSFFVACELSVHPEYLGRPVVVGEDRWIAVAMSHEAKALGVTRGMPAFQIKRQFPSVVILPHHFDLYRRISDRVYAILLSYFETVEVYSIDECFAAVKHSDIRFYGDEKKMIAAIKTEIQKTVGVTYSFGLARTMALAKTASKLDKPNGAVVLQNEADEREALQRTTIDDVWGIGRRTVPRLLAMGIKTAQDFIEYPREKIATFFSEPLVVLHAELSGTAIHDVHSDTDPRDQKSIQSTGTFKPSSSERELIWTEISENAENACERARELRLITNAVSFFVKTADFRHRFADVKLDVFTSDPGAVLNAIEPLLAETLVRGEKIRSTGVILHNLRREEDAPRDLFGRQEKAIANLAVEIAADKVRAKFGPNALKRAASLRGKGKEKDCSFKK